MHLPYRYNTCKSWAPPKTHCKGIKVIKGLPRASCIVNKVGTLRKKSRFREELLKVLLQLPANSPRTVCYTEATVLLSDIKKYHTWVHKKLTLTTKQSHSNCTNVTLALTKFKAPNEKSGRSLQFLSRSNTAWA